MSWKKKTQSGADIALALEMEHALRLYDYQEVILITGDSDFV